MIRAKSLTTTVSAKVQVVLPKAIRNQRHWAAGTKLVVENTDEGVLLKAAPLFAGTDLDAVFGLLAFAEKAKTIDEMDAAIAAEARRRARDDTNVVVRSLTGNDPKQAAKARGLVAEGDIYVARRPGSKANGCCGARTASRRPGSCRRLGSSPVFPAPR